MAAKIVEEFRKTQQVGQSFCAKILSQKAKFKLDQNYWMRWRKNIFFCSEEACYLVVKFLNVTLNQQYIIVGKCWSCQLTLLGLEFGTPESFRDSQEQLCYQ